MENNIQTIALNDGSNIQVSALEGIDIVRQRNTSVVASEPIRYPDGGLGGFELFLSPDERFLLVSIFSGQSEEGYELFDLRDGLQHIHSSGYLFGEAASYGFSQGEKKLVMALPCMCSEWWQVFDDGDLDIDDAGLGYFEFGLIQIYDIQSTEISGHIIRIYPTDNWNPKRGEYDPLLKPNLESSNTIFINMPWGREELKLPLQEFINFTPT